MGSYSKEQVAAVQSTDITDNLYELCQGSTMALLIMTHAEKISEGSVVFTTLDGKLLSASTDKVSQFYTCLCQNGEDILYVRNGFDPEEMKRKLPAMVAECSNLNDIKKLAVGNLLKDFLNDDQLKILNEIPFNEKVRDGCNLAGMK